MTRLDYHTNKYDLPDNAFGISPSQINSFLSKPHEWFRSEVLDEKRFEATTSTVLGTIVHFCAEEYIKTKTVDTTEIQKYMSQFALNSDIDLEHISSQWVPMKDRLITHMSSRGIPNRSEEAIQAEILPGYYACGTADAVLGTTLIDFKTTSVKEPKPEIPLYYRYQLLTYAWIYNNIGIPIDRIRILWITNNDVGRISDKTNKPMKDYPCQVVEASEMFTQESYDFIESILKLIAETVDYYKQHPELAYIIFKDYRLKQ